MEFRVPVVFTVHAENAMEAENFLKGQYEETTATVGSAEAVLTKPEVSKELREFLCAEIEANDLDADSWQTDLDYVKGSFAQMPNDILVAQSGYEGEDSEENFAEMLQNEFDALYDRFGGATKVRELVDY